MPATRGQRWVAAGLGCLLSAGLSARADQHFEDGLRLYDSGEYAAAKQHFAESSDSRAPDSRGGRQCFLRPMPTSSSAS